MKIVIIQSTEKALWQSCRSISANIGKMFVENVSKDHQVLVKTISSASNAVDVLNVAESIANENCDLIVWTEYNPLPNQFLKLYESLVNHNQLKRPSLLFYLYGDFILHLDKWSEIEETLKNYNVTLRCASSKHAGLVNKFFAGDNFKCDFRPFPVDPQLFYYDEKKRDLGRKSFGFKNDEMIYLYSGRLSYQKNIFHLINAFRDFLLMGPKNAKLVLAGPFDDLGMPYLGQSGPLNAFYGQLKSVLATNQNLIDEGKIIFLGDVPQNQLNQLYCASDVLVNLSTHNDEDYGMAPAEALCTGLPTILTSWGGFCDFKIHYPTLVNLVPLVKEKDRFLPDYKSIVRHLLLASTQNDKQRKSASLKAIETLSVSSVSKSSLILNSASFCGFSDTFKKTKAAFKNPSSGPFRGSRGQLNEFYFELYSGYGELKNVD